MPTIAFGLAGNKKPLKSGATSLKRKAAFDVDEDGYEATTSRRVDSLTEAWEPITKQKGSTTTTNASSAVQEDSKSSKYANLSALRNAKLQNEAASRLDSSVYDYDEVYDTFSAQDKQKKSNGNTDATVPKYMSNLLASAETRKRDQTRAKEKQLQRERELEGDDFADKEQFVTGAYKKQQEENRRLEEQEKLREEEENERRRKGGGMTSFHKSVLAKDEERLKAVEAAQEARSNDQSRQESTGHTHDIEQNESHLADESKQKGNNIITNDDGEIIDKRQLLTAGLNVVPKASAGQFPTAQRPQDQRPAAHNSHKFGDARASQRERQTRMVERQIEEMEARQKETELAERQAQEDKNKSKLTDSDKMSAKERYLQRKREREEEAKAKSTKT